MKRESETMTLGHPRSRFVERDGIKLHHLEWGEPGRTPIVLVHGVRLHAHVWNHFCRKFSDRYQLCALDQRGHGDSGWCADDGYHIEALYQDLCAVIEARGWSRFTLIGHSLGGRVSMLYAHRHPDTVDRLVLVDITAGRPPVAADADPSRITQTPSPRHFASPEDAAVYLKQLMSLAPDHMVEESVRHGIRPDGDGRYTWKYDPALFRMRIPAPPGLDFWDVVGSIPAPTLLQYGSHSNVVTAELAARMARTMPDCTVERIEAAGHGLFTDQPDAFAQSVTRFLARA
jgi:esterase